MDSEAFQASNRPKTVGNALTNVKKVGINAGSNAPLFLGPAAFNKAPQQQQQYKSGDTSRSSLQPQISPNDYDSKRGSMSGKSTNKFMPLSSQDKNLDRVKQIDRSEASSQASSRDTSLTRQDNSRDSSVTRSNEATNTKPVNTIPKLVAKKSYTKDQVDRKVTNMVEEYMHNDDVHVSLHYCY